MENGLVSKVLIGFATAALIAMGAGVVRHEAVLTGIGRDISYISANIEDIKQLLKKQ